MEHDERDDERSPSRKARRRWLGGWSVRGLLGAGLLLLGVAGGVVWSERRAAMSGRAGGGSEGSAARGGTATPATPAVPRPVAAATAEDAEPVEVSLTADAVERAGIKTTVVRSEASVATIAVPGTVLSNAYRDTKVNALVGGIVRRVGVDLGQAVERGEILAVIFSGELADAQMKYLSMRAMLVADDLKLERTGQLVAIGAASRQELEEITALHHARETELAGARQRLLLLGLTAEQVSALQGASHIVSEVAVSAPSAGLVVARHVNPGQVVAAGQDLFAVTDLSTVWVIGDLYEQDFGRVHVGSEATVTVPAVPREARRGRVTYIDPRVDPATRTAKVRVEVPNRTGELRLGMYVSVIFRIGAGERRTLVPTSAVQMLGERAVVYVPASDDEHRFIERTVRLGTAAGDLVQVLEGVKPGERVVTEGSFLLRAEAAKTRSGG